MCLKLTNTSGVFVYAVLNGLIGLVVLLSRGYIEPREYDLKEYWTWKGSGRPPWFVRALKRRSGGSEDDDEREDAALGSTETDSRGSETKADDAVVSAAAQDGREGPGPRWEP